ncbi:preprotein translocase subunit SecY [Dehalococcoidia bacterium]|nr:preprotein translocase subunit SecY [Dehalococcoidia bacterium]
MPKLLQAVMDSLHHADLRRKLLFTFGILVVFRFIAHIPLPGVDVGALGKALDAIPALAMVDLFGGGALRRLSIVAVGIFPYITASIIMQLLVPVIPHLQALSREGEGGRNKLKQYTLWLTAPLAMLSGYGQLVLLSRELVPGIPPAIEGVGLSGENLLPTVSMVLSLMAGTMLLVWLGERITESGIGNGISIIIFGGIVAEMPVNTVRTYETAGIDGLLSLLILLVAIALLIVFVTEAYRRIPVQYSRSTFRGGRVYRQSGGTHIPLRVNSSGMIPIIFALAVLMFPATIASYFANPPGQDPNLANWIQAALDPVRGWWLYNTLLFLLVIGFAFFYTIITFEQQNIPENLQKQGGFIPGIRPGRPTAEYINGVLMRITWGGAAFLGFIAISPVFAQWVAGVPPGVPVMIIGGVGLLIAIGVVLDTMRQMEAQLLMRHYEGFIK